MSHATFLYLLLAISFENSRASAPVFFKNETFTVPKPSKQQFYIAPEIWGFGQSFIFASVDRIFNSGIWMKIKVGDKFSAEKIECSMKFVSEINATNLTVNAFRRAAYYNVLLTTHQELDNGDRLVKFILIDLESCTQEILYRKPLPENYFIFSDYNFYKNTWKLTVLTSDNTPWCDQVWCRHSYDSFYIDFKHFDIDVPLDDMRIEPASTYYSENLLVVRGIDNHDTYKVSLYYMTNKFSKYKELFSLPDAREIKVVASNLAFCWISKSGNDNTVNCSKFSKDGRLLFNKTLMYDEPVEIIYMRDVYKGLFLLTRKQHCQGDDCWITSISSISNDYESADTSDSLLKLECSGDTKQLLFTATEETLYTRQHIIHRIISRYICGNGDKFIYNTLITDPRTLQISGKIGHKNKKYHIAKNMNQ